MAVTWNAGSTDAVEFNTAHLDLNDLTAITVACWVKSDDMSSSDRNGILMSVWGGATNSWLLHRSSSSNQLRAEVGYDDSGSADAVVSIGDITDGIWTFVAFTWTPTLISLYVSDLDDTNLNLTTSVISRTTITDAFVSKVHAGNDHNDGNPWSGQICHPAIWKNVALTADELLAFRFGTSPLRIRRDGSLELYSRLFNTTDINDLSGNGHTGTATSLTNTANDYPPMRPLLYDDELWVPPTILIAPSPDQGPAFIFADGQATNFVRTYLTGLGYEGGHGRPVTTPSDGGLFQAELINLPATVGPLVDAPRPDLGARPAGTEVGDSGDFADHVGGMFDWWEKVHILPHTEIAFGNIITQKQDTYELYSAYRDTSITLSSIVNNALPGVDLPDEAPPEVVPRQSSMLDSTSTDNTGDSFALGTLVLRDIVAAATGLPIFDTTIDFTFDTGEVPQLFISGQRIVLIPMDYESPMQETLAFLTDIIPGLSGVEQRIALRKQPRQLFEVLYKLDGNDRQRMQALLMDWTANVFGFPVKNEVLLTTAAASIGNTVYQVTGADDVDLRVGGLAAIITDANTFDVISIASKTDTSITASDPSLNAYPVGANIMPLRTAVILRMVAGAMAQKNLETFKVVFEVTDNDTGALSGSTAAYSTFNGRVLFDDCNVVAGEMAEQYKRRIYRIDNKTGKVSISSSWDRGKRSSQKGFVLRNRSEILGFRKAMISIGGRQVAFYIPTFNDDLEVKDTLGVGSDTMDIEKIKYERFIQSRAPKITFKITFADGTSLIREVQSAAGVDSTTERLTLDTTWPSTRTVDEVVRVQFYELSRFDVDNVRIQYPRIGLATCKMPVLQVFDDN